jgi:peroxiredoxin
MALIQSEPISLGADAPDFSLPGVDGATYSLDSFADADVLTVMFICNHCPYVQAVEDRLVALGNELQPKGAAFVAIMPNDVNRYPADHPDRMRERAEAKGYPFPYLYDESQSAARAYGAVCTPDIFVFDNDRKLAYRGRIDDNWRDPSRVSRHELRDAIEALLAGRRPEPDQIPSMGCSIKWRD